MASKPEFLGWKHRLGLQKREAVLRAGKPSGPRGEEDGGQPPQGQDVPVQD